VEWVKAPDISKKVRILIKDLHLDWLTSTKIVCFRSQKANTRAIARIWGLSRIWQQALNLGPFYIIEVVSEKFDNLSEVEQNKVLLHEIAHIPKNFSGALIPHFRRGRNKFNDIVNSLVAQYLNNS